MAAADCAGIFRATMQSASAAPPVPCVLRFPLPPHLSLLNHLRGKSRSRAMASSRPLYEFVGEIPPDLLCGICLLVPHNPHRVSCCGRYFCQPCIAEWTLAQHFQCPSCLRPNCSHHSDPSLSQRVLHLPIYCTSRHKGCTWQGLMRDLQMHLSSEDGCFFSTVECPLAELGCQPRTVQRRDLSKHMADKHTKHMKMIIGSLKHTSARLESQERQIEELQQRYLMIFSQMPCTLHNLVSNKTSPIQQDIHKVKVKISELEETLLKVRPHSLTHLDRALSDTFPSLKCFGEEGSEVSEDVMSLNGSLLHGLREIEGHGTGIGVVGVAETEARGTGTAVGGVAENRTGTVVVETGARGDEGEAAGLPISGDLPTETAATEGADEREEERGEGVKGVTQVAELEATTPEQSAADPADLNSDLQKPCSFNPVPTLLPTYATAVSNPFHPVFKGLSAVSKCPDSIPPSNHQSLNLQTNTTTGPDPVTITTAVTMDTPCSNHHGNEEDVMLPGNKLSDRLAQIMATTPVDDCQVTSDFKSDFKTGQQSGLDHCSELTAQLTDVLGEGFGTLVPSNPPGWTGWNEDGLCTPRSDSSFSIKSSSSSEMSFLGDTIIQYGTSTVVVSTTSGKKSPSPDSTQVKLFVKYMPHCCTPEKAVSIFLAYGKVHLLEYHSEHRDKLFLIMDREGGLQAMSALNGTRLEGSPKPLSVQLYRTVPSSSTPIVQRSESITSDKTLRLFVKHLGCDVPSQEIAELFSTYGRVYDVQKHPNRRNVAFVYMCQEGGKRAIAGLNGYHSRQITKPLLVELSHEPTVAVTKT